MSGTGKSTLVRMLNAPGCQAIDMDLDGWSHWVDLKTGRPATPPPAGDFAWDRLDWMWNAPRLSDLLQKNDTGHLVVAGTAINQKQFYPFFDLVVLLSAPTAVLLQRLAQRTDNPYGQTPRSRERILGHVKTVEPRLRAGADHELNTNRPVDAVLADIRQLLENPPCRRMDQYASGAAPKFNGATKP
jgi:shikimate kinase